MRRTLRAAAWLVGLFVLGAGLHLAGQGSLAPPPLTSPSGVLDWAGQRSPGVTAMGLLRLAAEATSWYLLALSSLAVAGELRSAPTGVGDRFGPLAARRLVRAGLGLGVAATWSVPLAAGPTIPLAGAAPVELSRDDPSGSATMRPHDIVDPSSLPSGTAGMRPAAQPEARPQQRTSPAGPRTQTWTVEAGECFWSIATEIVSDVLQRPATDGEVATYWTRLIDANRPRLVDPDDPDLLLPGQVLEVPVHAAVEH